LISASEGLSRTVHLVGRHIGRFGENTCRVDTKHRIRWDNETHRIRWDNETHKSGGTGNTQVEWTGNTRDPVGQETHRIRWDMKHTGSGGTGNTQDPVGQETHCGGVRPR